MFGDAANGASLVAELATALEQAGIDQAAGGLRFAVSRKRRPGDLSRGGRCGSITLDDLDAYGDLEEAIKAQWGGGLYLVRPAAPQDGKRGVPFVSGMSWEVEIEGLPLAPEEPPAAATPAQSNDTMLMLMMQQQSQQQQAMMLQQSQAAERMQRDAIASREQTTKLLCAVVPPLLPLMMGGNKGTDLADVTGALKDLHELSGGAANGAPVGPYDVVSQGITAMQQATYAGVFTGAPVPPGAPGAPGAPPVAPGQPGQPAAAPAPPVGVGAQQALAHGLPPMLLTAVQTLASVERVAMPAGTASDMAYSIVSSDPQAFGTLAQVLGKGAPATMQAITNLTGAAPSAWWTATIAQLIADLPLELERYAEQQAEQRAAAVAAQPAPAALPAPAAGATPTAEPAAPPSIPAAPRAPAAPAQPAAPSNNGNGRQVTPASRAAPAQRPSPAPPPPPPPPSTALEGVAAPNSSAGPVRG